MSIYNGTKIRRSVSSDINDIYELLKQGFPQIARYQASFFSQKKWLEYIISGKEAETYVICINNVIVGYAILVINLKKYQIKKEKLAPGYFFRLYGYLFSIKAFISFVKQKYRWLNSVMYGDYNRDKKEDSIYYSTSLVISNIVIEQKYRGMGLGKHLLMYIEDRVREYGKQEVVLAVLSSNTDAISFYKHQHYQISIVGNEFTSMIKKL